MGQRQDPALPDGRAMVPAMHVAQDRPVALARPTPSGVETHGSNHGPCDPGTVINSGKARARGQHVRGSAYDALFPVRNGILGRRGLEAPRATAVSKRAAGPLYSRRAG
jgi:hypothetical protein